MPEVPGFEMIRVFYGDDRVKISAEVLRALGDGYEVFEGAELTLVDLPTIFRGVTLFGNSRRILIKDLGENKVCFEKFSEYLDTDFEVVLWESKLDKRSVVYKALVKAGVEICEFRAAEPVEKKLVFEVLDSALGGNSRRAIEIIEGVGKHQAAQEFFGLLVYQGLKKFENGTRGSEKVVRELAKTDMEMKTTGLSDPWLSIKALLVRLSLS